MERFRRFSRSILSLLSAEETKRTIEENVFRLRSFVRIYLEALQFVDEDFFSRSIANRQQRLIFIVGTRWQTFVVNIVEQGRETLNEFETRFRHGDVQQLISPNKNHLFRHGTFFGGTRQRKNLNERIVQRICSTDNRGERRGE